MLVCSLIVKPGHTHRYPYSQINKGLSSEPLNNYKCLPPMAKASTRPQLKSRRTIVAMSDTIVKSKITNFLDKSIPRVGFICDISMSFGSYRQIPLSLGILPMALTKWYYIVLVGAEAQGTGLDEMLLEFVKSSFFPTSGIDVPCNRQINP